MKGVFQIGYDTEMGEEPDVVAEIGLEGGVETSALWSSVWFGRSKDGSGRQVNYKCQEIKHFHHQAFSLSAFRLCDHLGFSSNVLPLLFEI